MLNNYFSIRAFALKLQEQITGLYITEIKYFKDQEHFTLFIDGGLEPMFIHIHFLQNSVLYYLANEPSNRKSTFALPFKNFLNSRITGVKTCVFERIFFIETNKGKLVFKFFGNQANVIFVENETSMALRLHIKADLHFNLQQYAIEQEPPLLPNLESIDGQNWLNFQPFNNIEIQEYINANNEFKHATIHNLYEYLLQPKAYIQANKANSSFTLIPNEDLQECSILEGLRQYCTHYVSHYWQAKAKDEARSHLEGLIKSKKSKLSSLEKGLAILTLEQPKDQIANIIMANLHIINPQTQKVELFDFYTNKSITIVLNPKLTASQNAERLYKKAKNAHKELGILKNNIVKVKEEIEALELEISQLDLKNHLRTLNQKYELNKPHNNAVAIKYRTLQVDGFTVYIGKDAQGNEELLKKAHKNDIWLHARGVSGSHVIIKNGNNNVPPIALETAASLAAYYSKAKTSEFVPVIYCQRKYVRKKKGGNPGEVIIEREQVILVKPQAPNQLEA